MNVSNSGMDWQNIRTLKTVDLKE